MSDTDFQEPILSQSCRDCKFVSLSSGIEPCLSCEVHHGIFSNFTPADPAPVPEPTEPPQSWAKSSGIFTADGYQHMTREELIEHERTFEIVPAPMADREIVSIEDAVKRFNEILNGLGIVANLQPTNEELREAVTNVSDADEQTIDGIIEGAEREVDNGNFESSIARSLIAIAKLLQKQMEAGK
jgi:hypothetical protein